MFEAYALGEVIAEREITYTRADSSIELVTVRIGKAVGGQYFRTSGAVRTKSTGLAVPRFFA